MAVDLTAYRMDSILKKLRAIPLLSIFKFIRDIFAASVLVVAFIVIIWATVHYGEQNLDSDSPLCKPRTQVIGFIGDPDFYGLGIRLGLYLQWIAYLITAASLPQERRRVMISYVIFNLSITAAIMVKVFSRQCTFTTEFFVILTLFWGGIHVVQLPLMHASSLASLAKSFKESRTSNTHITRVISHTTEVSPSKACIPRTSRWLLWISQLFNFLISPITIWYWTRLAVVGQTDFAPTPGGSAFFFFGRISESGFKGLSIFMAIASAATYVQLVQAFLPLPCHLHEEPKLSDIFWIILYAITFPFSILMIFLRLVPMLFATAIARFYYKTHFEVDAVNEPDPTSPGILSPQEVFILIGYVSIREYPLMSLDLMLIGLILSCHLLSVYGAF